MPCDTPGNRSDILLNPLLSFLLYCVPAIAIVASAFEPVSRGWRNRDLDSRLDCNGRSVSRQR